MNKLKSNPYISSSILTPVGIIVVLFGYAFETMKLGNIIKNGLPSASFFPFLIFIIGLPFAVYLLITGILQVKKQIALQPEIKEEPLSKTKQKPSEGFMIKPSQKPFLITALTFIFILLFKTLGYSITAPLYLFGFQLIYDVKLGSYGKKINVSVVVTILV